MKKILCISTLALLVVSAAMAQTKPAAPKAATKEMHCAVMTKDAIKVNEATKGKLFADFKNKRYYFCCPACQASFKKDPAKYAAKADSTAIPVAKKTKKS